MFESMRILSSLAIGCLLAAMSLACSGCGSAGASAGVDCPLMLKRVKDGVFEIGRRHQSNPQQTQMFVESLHDRIAGYDVVIEGCDPESAETVVKILDVLQEILSGQQAGAALGQSLAALAALAESLPVEATPAQEYDD